MTTMKEKVRGLQLNVKAVMLTKMDQKTNRKNECSEFCRSILGEGEKTVEGKRPKRIQSKQFGDKYV